MLWAYYEVLEATGLPTKTLVGNIGNSTNETHRTKVSKSAYTHYPLGFSALSSRLVPPTQPGLLDVHRLRRPPCATDPPAHAGWARRIAQASLDTELPDIVVEPHSQSA